MEASSSDVNIPDSTITKNVFYEFMDSKVMYPSLSGYERDPFFINDGKGVFSDVAPAVGMDLVTDGRSVVSADFDRDGDLDLLVRNLQNPRLLYFENVAPMTGHWLEVRLRGDPKYNRDAIGAKVLVETATHKQKQLLVAGDGYLTQHWKGLWFGLGANDKVQRITVHWPDSTETVLTDVAADQIQTIAKK